MAARSTALAKNEQSLTLAGLTDVAPEVQEKLAETVGTLSLPNLTSLDSLPLAKKLASTVVLLPEVPLSDALLRTLLRSRLKLTLRDVEELTAGQIRIVAEELAGTDRSGPLGLPRLSLPRLRKLDSALLAETLGESTGFNFPGVTEISPEAAAALGALPERYIGPEGKKIRVPSGNLSFPSLEELSPEAARPLLKKRWVSISLPVLQEVSLETVRGLARQTARLTLGFSALPPNSPVPSKKPSLKRPWQPVTSRFPTSPTFLQKRPGFW
jgi:hypothetical protein